MVRLVLWAFYEGWSFALRMPRFRRVYLHLGRRLRFLAQPSAPGRQGVLEISDTQLELLLEQCAALPGLAHMMLFFRDATTSGWLGSVACELPVEHFPTRDLCGVGSEMASNERFDGEHRFQHLPQIESHMANPRLQRNAFQCSSPSILDSTVGSH